TNALGRAGYRPEVYTGDGHQIERRRVVLSDMQAIDAGLVRGGGKFQTLVERDGDRAIGLLDVIENTDLHDIPALVRFRVRSDTLSRRTSWLLRCCPSLEVRVRNARQLLEEGCD